MLVNLTQKVAYMTRWSPPENGYSYAVETDRWSNLDIFLSVNTFRFSVLWTKLTVFREKSNVSSSRYLMQLPTGIVLAAWITSANIVFVFIFLGNLLTGTHLLITIWFIYMDAKTSLKYWLQLDHVLLLAIVSPPTDQSLNDHLDCANWFALSNIQAVWKFVNLR